MVEEFPAYASDEFCRLVGAESDTLTQDEAREEHRDYPAGSPDDANDGAGGGSDSQEDPDGEDMPSSASAFDDLDFDPEQIPNDISALDRFNLKDTFQCPFMTVERLPLFAVEEWAQAYSRVAKDLLDACDLPVGDPRRRAEIARAAKWYSALPQLILREPGRSHAKNTHIIKLRLRQFLGGNFKPLVHHWFLDARKQHGRARKPRKDSHEDRIKRAVSEILSGDISRGLR